MKGIKKKTKPQKLPGQFFYISFSTPSQVYKIICGRIKVPASLDQRTTQGEGNGLLGYPAPCSLS